MALRRPVLTRRTLLAMAALVSVAGCTKDETTVPASTAASGAPEGQVRHARLAELERDYGARLGVYALATGTGDIIDYRADERFAFCSTFKGLAAAAVLHRNPLSHLDTVVHYTEADLLKNATITPGHVAEGMTIRALCDAAIRYSDGTAGNLLLRDLGGPSELTAYARSLGDTVTRMDRVEPDITEATPGDPRDTTSPRAFGTDYQHIVLGEALAPEKRAFLRDLLERNATKAGARRIRAGLPRGWVVADKTGTGDYGTLNDIAIVRPPDSAPLVIAIMSSKATVDAAYEPALLAEAAEYVAATLRR
ncbi:class A beta-lactamase [Nocardia donostiensis]|uniref:Beta-lactamase n=1 Tax=Nocardia donostiensis TaxID=1538463 RepID=A0A1W0ARC9_9NOCA|nr:class A beta-lactamase [Nocardia donostiensis]ONM46714.1 class A beta-lactamase [Nocardia donostiensis]OQS12793.1 class A beta-lactamase [Nocardia donostiensis]OQS19337.1 class A beta-lactamase [Nocardia donostiensis]